jgi:recombination protein RecA
VDQGLIKKSGAFYSHGETRLGQGRENAKEFLEPHQDLAQALEAQVRSRAKPEPSHSSNGAAPEDGGPEYSLAASSTAEDSTE